MCSQSVFVFFQRYSVAVYLVRVFTATDLFSQLKLNSVESAERCRERSKCHSCTHLVGLLLYIIASENESLVPLSVLDACKSFKIIIKQNIIFVLFFIILKSKTNYGLIPRVK